MRVRVGSLWCNQRMPPLPDSVQQRLPGSAEVETPISVDVIRMHPDNINICTPHPILCG